MKMKTAAAGLAVAGLAVAGLFAAGCGSAQPGAAARPTVTITKSRTVTASPAPVPTVTITKLKTRTIYRPRAGTGGSASGHNQVIVRFSGTGTQNTPAFTTPASWHLSWAYWGCPDGRSNFQVDEHNADGSLDLNGVSVNELGRGRGPVATYAYGDPGRHYLEVNTEGCNWSLVPVTG